MAQTAVRDVVIWAKHIHGSDTVKDRVIALRGGETLDLQVDGWRGPWVKMKDGSDGRPTHGIRPIGRTQAFWSELFASRRGDLVSLALTEGGGGEAGGEPAAPSRTGFRTAARQAVIRGLSGFRSDGSTHDRDDLHDRAGDRRGL